MGGSANTSPAAIRLQRRLAFLVVVVPAAGTVVAAALAWTGGVRAAPLAVAGVMFVATALGVEVGLHRLFSHQSFQTSPAARVVMAVLGSMAAQGPVLFWVAIHRRHHAFADKPGDPHSPNLRGEGAWNKVRGLWHAHAGWLFEVELTDWRRFVPDLLRDRAIFAVNMSYPWWVLLGLALPAAVAGAVTGSARGALEGFLWGGLVRAFAVDQLTWGVNSLCHAFGRRPFPSRDQSTNNPWLALVSLGGSWHNNHHAFPSAARNGVTSWQLDPAGAFIGLLERVGLAWDVHGQEPER
jgi:stearoyl-CoA desaturase (Delta-9 desaturase)